MSVNFFEKDDLVEVKHTLTDHMYEYENTTSSYSPGNDKEASRAKQKEVRLYKLATVTVLLLCGVLLLVIIGLCVKISRDSHELHATTARLTQFQSTNTNLTRERDELKASKATLTKEKERSESNYNTLVRERDQLNANYTSLTKDREQLQTSYDSLARERDQLNISYTNTYAEKIQLQTSYNDLLRGQEALNTSYVNSEKEKNEIHHGLWNLGWKYFDSHLYHISTRNKSWDEARQDCKSRGADLVIINTQQEQEFVSSLNKEVWIGLSDVNVEGQWRWVDGTPLTTKFWAKDQPNSYKGEQDCVKLWLTPPLENWNDEKCSIIHSWVCEKPINMQVI